MTPPPRPRPDWLRPHLAIAALFCTLGFQYATWVSRLPALKGELDLTTGQVGLLLMACGVGAAATFPVVPVWLRRLGSRRLAQYAALCLGGVLLLLTVVPDFPLALLLMVADGVAVGCLNVAMNAQGTVFEERYARKAMARLHAAFSGGSVLGALLSSGVHAVTPSLTAHFGIATAVLVLLVAFAGTGLPTGDAEDTAAPRGKRKRLTLPWRLTVWMGLAMAFGTVTEGAVNDWSTLYLRDTLHASAQTAPLGIAVASVAMVAARLFADGWRARWGDGRVVRAGSVLAGAGLAAALLWGEVAPALAGFACVGIGMAAVTPCVYVAASRHGPDSLSLVAAWGVTGLLGGPAVIGFVAQATGLVWGMAVVAASALLVTACATRIGWTAPAEGEAGDAGAGESEADDSTAGSSEPSDSEPAGTEPVDSEPVDSEPGATETAAPRSAALRSADTGPVATKPADARPAATQPTTPIEPADLAATKPAPTQPTAATQPTGATEPTGRA